MSGFTRILVTSAIVPLVFPLILVLVGSVQYLFGLPGYRPFFVGAAWALFLTFPATIALGLPAHFTAQQRGATGLVGYVLGGVIIGVLASLLLPLAFPFGYQFLKFVLWGMVAGAGSAFVFWLIVTNPLVKISGNDSDEN